MATALSLGRKPKENEENVSLAAKRRQQIDYAQIAVAASRLNSRKHSVTHGLRRGLRAFAASRLTRFVGNDKAYAQGYMLPSRSRRVDYPTGFRLAPLSSLSGGKESADARQNQPLNIPKNPLRETSLAISAGSLNSRI